MSGLPRLAAPAWSWWALAVALLAALLLSAPAHASDPPQWDMKGTWNVATSVVAVPAHQWSLPNKGADEFEVLGTTTLAGESLNIVGTGWFETSVTWVRMREYAGQTMNVDTMKYVYEGKMSDANSMAGDLYQAGRVIGTWTAKRATSEGTTPAPGQGSTTSPAPSPAPAKRAVGMSVICHRSDDPDDFKPCIVSVGDGANVSLPRVTPTGIVTWTVEEGVLRGTECRLVPTPSSPGVASCSIDYRRAAGVPAGIAFKVTAHYAGDATFGAGSARHQMVVAACIGAGYPGAGAKSSMAIAPIDITTPAAGKRDEPTVVAAPVASSQPGLHGCSDGFNVRLGTPAQPTPSVANGALTTTMACAPSAAGPTPTVASTGSCITQVSTWVETGPIVRVATNIITHDKNGRTTYTFIDSAGKKTQTIINPGNPDPPAIGDYQRLQKQLDQRPWYEIVNKTAQARAPRRAKLPRRATISMGARTVVMAPGTTASLQIKMSPQGRKVIALFRKAKRRTMPMYMAVDMYDPVTKTVTRVTKRIMVRVR